MAAVVCDGELRQLILDPSLIGPDATNVRLELAFQRATHAAMMENEILLIRALFTAFVANCGHAWSAVIVRTDLEGSCVTENWWQ